MDPAELSLPADEKEAWLIRTEATIYNPLPVVEKWRFVRNLVAQYLDLYKAEKARDKWDKKVVPLLIKITDAVSALTPLLTYEPDNPRRDRTTSIEEWMGTLLEDVERRIANSIALIDHMSKLSFIARRMSSAKQLDHLVAEYTDNFRYYRGKIQSDLLYYFEPDFADSEPLRWKKTGWFDAFREPQIVRRMMEFLQSRGVDQNRLTDAQIVSEVEAFYDHLQQNGESGSLDSLPKTAADRSHFAREACALLRTHFPHQTEAMAARLGKLDDATIFTAFQEDPQFVTSIVTAIIDSDEAKKTAAQLRDRAAQCFLDILQMIYLATILQTRTLGINR
ncbi:hypothetical protein PUNSTDRAFT_46960 [Punctularia strigosozonata HHB-11173 SS5]|uniref:Uncharacterized protein n=1 Tax=Punctularia strigosozonata (strain HHB-11173) TaxID=741275 RepID=R7S576_PUNST|nr:uncharacterized protein PUNSTDRAFT_46960 [Punctularia strigosozonata HHB-11173 SS5]EIN05089.1 hypothetical protein PUNSTDRAFT_46960 [Punctularia strigosozonata HHB-11173 SS5]